MLRPTTSTGALRIFALFALAALAWPGSLKLGYQDEPPQPNELGSIEGIVINDENGQPISGADVFFDNAMGPSIGLRPEVKSNLGGASVFSNIKPGQYTVGAEKKSDGYPDMEGDFYNPRPLTWPYPIVTVAPGQVTSGVKIRLGPKAGRFTGRVVDEVTGEPVQGGGIIFYHAEDPKIVYLSTSFRREGKLDVLVPTKKRFVAAMNVPGYSTCWLGEKGCQAEPHVFEFSSPATKDFSLVLRRTKEPPE